MVATVRRTVLLRQRIVRDTRAGRECQDSSTVPSARTTRRVSRTRQPAGGSAMRHHHTGSRQRSRTKNAVRAGRVVAEVAVRWVDRKSVRRRKGSSKMLQRDVKSCRAETISSKDLWCWSPALSLRFGFFDALPLREASLPGLLLEYLWFIQPVEESGE